MKKLFMCFLLIAIGSVASLASTKSAQIKNVTFVHKDIRDGEEGLTLKVSFNIDGCLNENCDILALFYNRKSGAQLSKKTAGYRYDNEWLCTFKKFKPPYKNTRYTEMKIFIPCSAFELPNGDYEIQVEFLVRNNGYVLAKSGRYTFNFHKKESGCELCLGMGVCSSCLGTGGRSMGTMYTGYRWYPCYSCGGNKYCKYCKGKKYISYSFSWEFTEKKTNYPSNSMPPSYNFNNGGNAKVKTNRKRCTLCNNGRIKVPISTWTEASARRCDECGEFMKYSGHFHQDCSVCYGQGYTETYEAVIE